MGFGVASFAAATLLAALVPTGTLLQKWMRSRNVASLEQALQALTPLPDKDLGRLYNSMVEPRAGKAMRAAKLDDALAPDELWELRSSTTPSSAPTTAVGAAVLTTSDLGKSEEKNALTTGRTSSGTATTALGAAVPVTLDCGKRGEERGYNVKSFFRDGNHNR